MSLPNYKTLLYSGPTKSIVGAVEGSTDYIDIKWIGSTGTQYIITDIVPQATYNIEVKGQKEANTALFGVGSGVYSLTGKKSANYFYVGTDAATAANRQNITITDQNAVHIWGIKDKVGYCDGISATGTYGTVETTDQLAFFGRCQEGAVSDTGTHRIYYAKVWNTAGTLVGDFVPKVQLSTGKPGLYDNVTNKFYPNNGTGEFIYELENYKTIVENNINYKTIVANEGEE